MKSVTKNSVFNIIYTTANLAFPLITTMYVSRVLLPAGVGAVSYAQNLVSYFVTAAGGGLAIYGVREIAKQRDNLKEKNVVYSSLFTIYQKELLDVSVSTGLIHSDALALAGDGTPVVTSRRE